MQLFEIGCGIAGAYASKALIALGFDVVHICVSSQCDRLSGDILHPLSYSAWSSPNEFARAADGLDEYAFIVDASFAASDICLSFMSTCLPSIVINLDTGIGEDSGVHGIVAEAFCGLAGSIGSAAGDLVPLGYLFGENVTGLFGAIALVEALTVGRGAGGGQPEVRNISAVDACLSNIDTEIQDGSFGSSGPYPGGSHRVGLVPYGLFRGADGYVGIAGSWDRLVSVSGIDALAAPRLLRFEERRAARLTIIDAIEEWVNTFASVDEVVAVIGNAGIAERARTLEEVLAEADGELIALYDGVPGFVSPLVAEPGAS